MAYTRRLDEIDRQQVDEAGGKGANLGELIRAGFPVPPGYVVTTSAYQAFLEHAGLTDMVSNLATGEAGSETREQIRQAFRDVDVPSDITSAILDAETAIAEQRPTPTVIYAVRSSATAEDAADASFAGQHETYYYVTRDKLLNMVRYCWASLFADNAVAYRETQGIPHDSVQMAVVVQVMVQSEVAGVTFSANPITGSNDEIVTEASWGMGAAIVDGRVTPDRFVTLREPSTIIDRHLADKKVMVPAGLTGAEPTRLQNVPHELRRAATLDDASIHEIAALAQRAEEAFGSPQDIEWAMENGELYMLQSRPITTLAKHPEEEIPEGRYLIFKPLLENFTDPMTPLLGDLCDKMLPPGTVVYKGRIYMDLNVIKILSPQQMTDEQLVKVGYLNGLDDDEKPKLSLLKILGQSLGFTFMAALHGTFFGRTANMPDDFMVPFRERMRMVKGDPSIDPLRAFWSLGGGDAGFWEPVGTVPLGINLTAGRYIVWLGIVKSLLNRWAPELPPDTNSLICSGSEGVKSTEMGRGIVALAEHARTEPDVVKVFMERPITSVLTTLRQAETAKPFMTAFDAFLDTHGHRALKEFEISVPRWHEDPTPVLAMIKNYLSSDDDPMLMEKAGSERRTALLNELNEALDKLSLSSLRRGVLEYCIERAKYFTKLRENSRYYHIMIFDVVRAKVLAVEEKLLASGALKCQGDIFYLTFDEMYGLERGELGWSDVEQQIHDRRLEWVRNSKSSPLKTLGFELENAEADRQADGDQLKGFGASPGYYEGVARLILDPAADAELKPGEILVAPYTDPAWTPLFLTARAAVVEIGSYLSHAGTIAREYGMPCVVDVENCTHRITSGMRLAVNGDAGTVTILDTDEGAAKQEAE
ncbi:MAG: PEP/pyruvate-binding domain-containing protein [Pseudomonadota bacterium]